MRTTATYSCKLLRKHGYEYAIVESWNPFSRTHHDFLGYADILAFRPPLKAVLAIQTCAAGDIAKHVRKFESDKIAQRIRNWLLCDNRFEIWGWEKRDREEDWKPELVRVVRDYGLYPDGTISIGYLSEVPD